MKELNYFPNNTSKCPEHGSHGEYREFFSKEKDRSGRDIYCSNCNNWNTVFNTNILFSVVGFCKNCGTPIGRAVIKM